MTISILYFSTRTTILRSINARSVCSFDLQERAKVLVSDQLPELVLQKEVRLEILHPVHALLTVLVVHPGEGVQRMDVMLYLRVRTLDVEELRVEIAANLAQTVTERPDLGNAFAANQIPLDVGLAFNRK